MIDMIYSHTDTGYSQVFYRHPVSKNLYCFMNDGSHSKIVMGFYSCSRDEEPICHAKFDNMTFNQPASFTDIDLATTELLLQNGKMRNPESMQKEEPHDIDAGVHFGLDKRDAYLKEKGYDVGTHPLYKIGQSVTFRNGVSTLLTATIKGIDGNDLYVYNDCYWVSIKDTAVLNKGD